MPISRIRAVKGHVDRDLDLVGEDESGTEFAEEMERAMIAERERAEPRVEPLRRNDRLFSREEIDRELGKPEFSSADIYALRDRLKRLRVRNSAMKSKS